MFEKKNFFKKILSKSQKLSPHESNELIHRLADEREFFLSILDEIPIGVIVLSNRLEIKYCNDSASRILGINSSTSLGRPFQKVINDPALFQWLESHQIESQARTSEEIALITPHPTRIRASLICQKGIDEKIVLLEPLSTRASAAIERMKTQHRNHLLQLAGGLAHEIGNPLGSIAIHLSLLRGQLPTAETSDAREAQKTLEVIGSEVSRLDHIVKNFLRISRRGTVRFKTDHLHTLLDEALHFIEPQCRLQRIRLHFKKDAALEPFLMDREKLYGAFLNMLKNAMEAMPSGGKLFIETQKVSRMAIIRIQDTGAGISEKHLPRIFDPYFTTKEAGAGLGLVSVFNAVDDHHGRIEVQSKPGEGSEFLVYLPIRTTKLQIAAENRG